MLIVDCSHLLTTFLEQVSHIHDVGRIGFHRVVRPRNISETSPVSVMTPALGCGRKRFTSAIGQDVKRSTVGAMSESCFGDPCQVVESVDIHDGVMNEHRIKLATEPYVAHVSLDVLALGIEFPAQGQHSLRPIDQGHFEMGFEVRSVVTAAAPQFQQGLRSGCAGTLKSLADEVCLVDITFG